jgi:hypothetical protein
MGLIGFIVRYRCSMRRFALLTAYGFAEIMRDGLLGLARLRHRGSNVNMIIARFFFAILGDLVSS